MKKNDDPVETGKKHDEMKRREFLVRAAKAGVLTVAACSLGYFFRDPEGPGNVENTRETVSLPDFSMNDKKKNIAATRGFDDRKEAVAKALDALGGIGEFVKKGDRVLLKVNAAFASPPSISATTHPDLVSETVRLCYAAGAGSVIVTDNPINDPATCFLLSGIEKAAVEQGAKVILPRESLFKPATVKGAGLIVDWPILFEPFDGVNKLIGIAPLKDHHRSGASMTMKNWYGLLGGRRNLFHQDIHGIIKELAVMVSPTLVILDGTTAMMKNGPTGGSVSDLKRTRTVIVGTDQVAVDAFGAAVLEKKTDSLPHIAKAAAEGVGTADYESLKPRIVNA